MKGGIAVDITIGLDIGRQGWRRRASPRLWHRAIACYFTHGDRRTQKKDNWREVTIGKAFLVSTLQASLG